MTTVLVVTIIVAGAAVVTQRLMLEAATALEPASDGARIDAWLAGH